MYNLAGNPDASSYVEKELREAGIEIIQGRIMPGEVKTNLTGRVGEFTFKRAWYYWIVEGPVPLDIAKEIYATKIGKKDIRVAGHAGCPPPENWADPNFNDLLKEMEDAGIKLTGLDQVAELRSKGVIKAPLYVHLYHIDSQEGLNLFSETIKKHDLI